MKFGNPIEARIGSREAAVLRRQTGRQPRRRQEPGAVALLQPLPLWAWLSVVVATLWGATSQYPMLTGASVLTLPLLAILLLIKGESPILFVCAAMQWLQATVAVFYCDIWGGTLEERFLAPEMERATWLSLQSIVALALGMRMALGRWTTATSVITNEVGHLSLPRLIRLWWFSFLLSWVAGQLAWKLGGGLTQLIHALTTVKWVVFYMVACNVMVRNQGYRQLSMIMLFEFASGLIGFFSSFKEVLIMFLVATMTSHRRFSTKIKMAVAVVAIIGVGASVIWQVVKMEYRSYLNIGRMKQSAADRYRTMGELISGMDARKLDVGFNSLVERISYTQLLGATLQHVPAYVPYEEGELWLSAVKHVLMPRLIFPNKGVVDDSLRAVKYTGLNLAGAEEYTSIGIGYIAESYVDFGPIGMMVPVFLLGLLMGYIFRYFTLNSVSRLWGTAVGTAILFSMYAAYAYCNSKILGALLVQCLVVGFLNAVYGKKVLTWLATDSSQPRR